MIDDLGPNQQQKQAAGRILQLDAHVLDSTLIGIIRSQLQLFTKLLLQNQTRTYANENWWHQFLLNNTEVLLESLVPLLYFLAPIFTGFYSFNHLFARNMPKSWPTFDECPLWKLYECEGLTKLFAQYFYTEYCQHYFSNI